MRNVNRVVPGIPFPLIDFITAILLVGVIRIVVALVTLGFAADSWSIFQFMEIVILFTIAMQLYRCVLMLHEIIKERQPSNN